ncbi:hypothetical protein F183_A54760 (plasmid) [Bryobacterales bacterium F-183]|nr:hypothetical protein F183_A54760 [Bryobacterales bacterium F-183]
MDLYTITGREDVAAAALAQQGKSWRRGATFVTSVVLHAVALTVLAYFPVYAPMFLLDEPEPVRPERRVLIYYPPPMPRLKQQQPKVEAASEQQKSVQLDVSPRAAERITSPRVKIRTPEPISIRTEVARRPVNNDQFIRVPVPKIAMQPPVASPSSVIVQAVPAPPPLPPPPVVAPRTPARTFVPPPVQARTQPPAMREGLAANAEAPKLATLTPAAGERVPNVMSRREFVPPPPPGAKPVKREIGVIEDPKALALVAGPTGDGPRVVTGPKQMLPPPPPGAKPDRRGVAGGSGTQAEAPPTLQGMAGAMPGPQTMVVLTTNPTPGAPPPQPQGNRDARITVGGEAPPGTATSRRPAGGFVAPGAVVRSAPGTGTEVGAGGPPGIGAGGVKPAPSIPGPGVARPQFNSTGAVSVPLRPGTRTVSAEVDKTFAGRVVYSTVVPSVAGQPDWVLWFGDPVTPAPPPGRVFSMRPPIPEKATLPQGLAGLPAKTWIQARLTREGTLTGITGASPELAAALGKWLFYPAIRNGQAAEVDVLIEAVGTGR